MRDFGLKFLFFVSTVILEAGVVCQSDDYVDGCLPQLADRCFSGLMKSIPCHFKTSGECTDQITEFDAFCNGINDALSCSSDIIDSDCSVAEGRKTFDNWLKGLDAVRAYFCSQNNQSAMTVLAQNAHCWDVMNFIECVNKRTQIDHVVKLLQSMLDKNECIFLVGITSECNALAIGPEKVPDCFASHSMEVMGEAIHTFFTNAKCQWDAQRCGLPNSANKDYLSFGMYMNILLISLICGSLFYAV